MIVLPLNWIAWTLVLTSWSAGQTLKASGKPAYTPRVEIDRQNGVIGSDDRFGSYGLGSNY